MLDQPLKYHSLKAELVVQGLNSPTSMAFLDQNTILVLEKIVETYHLYPMESWRATWTNTPRRSHYINMCRGLLGIAVMNDTSEQCT